MADPTVILTDSQGHDLQAVSDVILDLAYGDDENDFTLIIRDSFDVTRFTRGSRVYMDGTEYGGVVDTVSSSVTTAGSVVEYSGRTWQGLLAHKILSPDTGQDYLTVSGSVSSVLTSLFSRIKLDSVFVADPDTRQISYQFERFTDAWTGLRKMAKASSLKPHMSYTQGRVQVSLLPVKTYEDVVDSDLLDFTATKNYRPVNHLIGLGTGELKDRAVSNWYADSKGTVSETQSLFGLDEVVEIYDYSNAEAEELREETRKKLEELQSEGTIEVTLHDSDVTLDLGDNVAARDNTTGLTVTSEVSKKIIKIEDGVLSVNYEVGDESTSQSLSGSSESSGGVGHSSAIELVIDGSFELGDSSYWTIENAQGMSINYNPAASHSGNYRFSGNVNTPTASVQLLSQPFNVSPGRMLRLSGWFWNDGDITAAAGRIVYNNGTSREITISSKTDSWVYNYVDVKVPDGASTGYVRIAYYSPGQSVFVRADDISVKDITDMTASFLAAYPVGSIYHTSRSVNPGDVNGGTWKSLPSEIGYLWERLT